MDTWQLQEGHCVLRNSTSAHTAEAQFRIFGSRSSWHGLRRAERTNRQWTGIDLFIAVEADGRNAKSSPTNEKEDRKIKGPEAGGYHGGERGAKNPRAARNLSGEARNPDLVDAEFRRGINGRGRREATEDRRKNQTIPSTEREKVGNGVALTRTEGGAQSTVITTRSPRDKTRPAHLITASVIARPQRRTKHLAGVLQLIRNKRGISGRNLSSGKLAVSRCGGRIKWTLQLGPSGCGFIIKRAYLVNIGNFIGRYIHLRN